MLTTLGYQLRSIDEYIEILEQEEVDVLIDVRENAWSHKPGFSKSQLVEKLKGASIEYVHADFAGNPKRFRDESESPEECLRRFKQHISGTPGILNRFDSLVRQLLDDGRKPCLMCYERHPMDCHRSVLLAAWQNQYENGVNVKHLDPEGAPRLNGK